MNFIFMKLDIKKAFVSLEWGSLFAVLEKFGFGPTFISYIQATMVGVASSVLLNGRFTNPFLISCSIRQGCLLFSLLFVIVMDVLSNMLTKVIKKLRIRGVSFDELDYEIGHGIYADDIHLIIWDHQEDVVYFLALFDRFEVASGLVCDWEKTHVVYLSQEDMSARLLKLGWIWEDKITTMKLLGIHIVDEIVPGLMTKQLSVRLERGFLTLY